MGFISLFADMAYEGARSITGPYMSILGASGFVVSFIAGFGELLGYGLRIFFGYLSDRTKKYWAIAMTGYFITLVAVPLTGLANSWQMVAALIFAERLGKAIRAPARDTIISYAAKKVGSGYSYGLHEAMDQIGGLSGPILISIFFYFKLGYQVSFMLLVVPAIVAMALLFAAQRLIPHPERMEKGGDGDGEIKVTKNLWIYIVAVSLVGMGYSDFPLIAYHAKKHAIMADGLIPLLYSLTMVVTAVSALVFGRLFDRIGLLAVILGVACSMFFSWFAFLGGIRGIIVGLALWGVGMGVQESIMRAAIANMMRSSARGAAFGVFNASYGLFSFLGSAIIGYLYDTSVIALVWFSVVSHLMALALLLYISGQRTFNHVSSGKSARPA
jgi:MFS family permease